MLTLKTEQTSRKSPGSNRPCQVEPSQAVGRTGLKPSLLHESDGVAAIDLNCVAGHTFRGDSRLEFNGRRMAYYGDRLNETLALNQLPHADGKVALRRGVSDSTTLIGCFHSTGSVRSNDSQNSATPENFVGVAIEGPSSEGFYFYPTYGLETEGFRADGGRGTPTPPFIYPDGRSRRWTLDYDPEGNAGRGSILVSLEGQAVTLHLDAGHKELGAQFNRFGIITTHIDGTGQTVCFDDLTYAIEIAPPSLTITGSTPTQILIHWPAHHLGWVLEGTPRPGEATPWQLIAADIAVNAAFFEAFISITGDTQFFRLRKP